MQGYGVLNKCGGVLQAVTLTGNIDIPVLLPSKQLLDVWGSRVLGNLAHAALIYKDKVTSQWSLSCELEFEDVWATALTPSHHFPGVEGQFSA